MAGGLITHLGDMPLMICTAVSAVQLIRGVA